ncbi:MAG: hypothetical protein ACJ8GN_25975 [Longimicrobiaceae bacterium]
MRYFKDESTHPNRALQVWLILIGRAANRQTMTYEMLARQIGFPRADFLAPILGHIMYYCSQTKLRGLTALVVYKDGGTPGSGFVSEDPNMEREQVYGFDWYSIFPPSPEELREAYQRGEADRKAKSGAA